VSRVCSHNHLFVAVVADRGKFTDLVPVRVWESMHSELNPAEGLPISGPRSVGLKIDDGPGLPLARNSKQGRYIDRGESILWTFEGSRKTSEGILKRMRRLPQDRRHLGTSAHVPGMRPRRLLRLFKKSACTCPLRRNASPDHSVC
jgi:hypothetical protein